MSKGFLVNASIAGANPKMSYYSLLEGDLLTKASDGSYRKVCPGLDVGGFILTTEQEAALTPATFQQAGLDFRIQADN